MEGARGSSGDYSGIQSKIRASQTKSNSGELRKIMKDHPEFELTYDMMVGIHTMLNMVDKEAHDG